MENVKLFLSQKSQFDLVEKIRNKNKKRTRASLFQSSKDGKQEKKFYVALCVTICFESPIIDTQSDAENSFTS